jgi:hypothetical protein
MISDLLVGKIDIEEKLDGSQFRILISEKGVQCGSKSVDFDEDHPVEKTFKIGVEKATEAFTGLALSLKNGDRIHIFGEYFASPKHNTLAYERIPRNHIMIYDIATERKDGVIEWATYEDKKAVANLYGFEVIPLLWSGNGADLTNEMMLELLKKESVLGKEVVEGIVIKNIEKTFDPIKFPHFAGNRLAGKFVRSEFKERNNAEWKVKKGGMEVLLESIHPEARWKKSVQHLRDQGKLEGNMKDMRPLIDENTKDFEEEEKENIKELLWEMHKKQIIGKVNGGMADWYKRALAEKQFEQNKDKERLEAFNSASVPEREPTS